jgi:uncharacterized alkaline shock family protein YloU
MTLALSTDAGSITVPASTLVAVAVAAAEGIDGVRVLRRRRVDLDARAVRLSVSARRGEPLLELARAAQDAVADALAAMCDLDVTVELRITALA